MSEIFVPYLCSGVLFLLVKDVAIPSPTNRELFQGTKDDHSDPKMMLDMIRALSKEHLEIDKNLLSIGAFKTEVS